MPLQDLTVFAIEVEAVSGILDGLDYYQVLKVPQDAGASEIKLAFHRESRTYHPDRLFHLDDPELKSRVHRIYKRITEAYSVLREPEMRAKYTADIGGPLREQKLRYDEESESERRRAREEEIGATPNGRKFYGAGMVDLEAGRWEAAVRNFKVALMYEPQNQLFHSRLREADAMAKVAG